MSETLRLQNAASGSKAKFHELQVSRRAAITVAGLQHMHAVAPHWLSAPTPSLDMTCEIAYSLQSCKHVTLQEAYELLSNPAAKSRYDASGATPGQQRRHQQV